MQKLKLKINSSFFGKKKEKQTKLKYAFLGPVILKEADLLYILMWGLNKLHLTIIFIMYYDTHIRLHIEEKSSFNVWTLRPWISICFLYFSDVVVQMFCHQTGLSEYTF